MVRRLLIVVLLAAGLSTSACSLRKYWGEQAPPRGVVDPPASGASCPDVESYFIGSDQQSKETLDCWGNRLMGLWTDLKGRQDGFLADSEIATLIRNKVLPVNGQDGTLKRILAAKKLFGMNTGLSKEDMQLWLAWFADNRKTLRSFYKRVTGTQASELHYSDFEEISNVASSFLSRALWRLSSEELTDLILTLFPPTRPQSQKAVLPVVKLGINFLNTVCPTFQRQNFWDSLEIAGCALAFTNHFKAGAPWLEFIINNGANSRTQYQDIKDSLDQLSPLVKKWFGNDKLAKLDTTLWLELAKVYGVPVTDKSLESIQWVITLNDRSTQESIHPSFFADVFELFRSYHKLLLDGLPYFQRCWAQDPAMPWQDCAPTLSDTDRTQSKSIDLALRIRNPNYGQKALALNGALFQRIMFYNAASKLIVDKFGNPNTRVIKFAPTDAQNNVLKVITGGMQFIKSTDFMKNIARAVQGLKLEDPSTLDDDLRKLNLQELSRLITLVGDLLTPRSPEEDAAQAEDLKKEQYPTAQLDEISLTSTITLLDTLADYRTAYLKTPGAPIQSQLDSKGKLLISRKMTVAALPTLLKEYFPRIYQSCDRYGLERSCGIAFETILPVADDGGSIIHGSDLDVITLLSVATEGLIETCDQDRDLRFNSQELDCVFDKLRDTTERLMDAKVIADSPSVRSVFKTIASTFITRAAGKVAMIRGTKDRVALFTVFVYPFLKKIGTPGSLFALLSESINGDRVNEYKRIEKEKSKNKPKKKDSGDDPTADDEDADPSP